MTLNLNQLNSPSKTQSNKGELEGWSTLQLPRFRDRSELNIYLINHLQEHVKWPVQQTQNCKISMTQGNNRIFNKSRSESPASIVQQKPEASNETNRLCKERSMDKRVYYVTHCVTLQILGRDSFFPIFILSYFSSLKFYFWETAKAEGRYEGTGK